MVEFSDVFNEALDKRVIVTIEKATEQFKVNNCPESVEIR